MTDHTPMTDEVRSSYPISDEDKVTHPALAWDRIITIEAFDRWLAAHDSEIRTAASRPIVHFYDDHEECARELAEVQRKLATAKAVAASAEETTRAYREQAAATRTATLEEAAELLRREAHRVAQLKILKPDYRQALVDTFYEASRVVMRAESAGPR